MTTQKGKLPEQQCGVGTRPPRQSLLVSTTDPPPKRATSKTSLRPVAQTDVQTDDIDTEDALDDVYPPRMPSSTRRYQQLPNIPDGYTFRQGTTQFIYHTAIPQRRSAPEFQQQIAPPRQRPALQSAYEGEVQPRRRIHWLTWVGLALLIMIIGWVGLTALTNWWQVTQDDWHYGRPRTFQIDAMVGHDNDSPQTPSHFTAINLNRHIEIIELPAGDGSKAKIYVGPTLLGEGQDLTPITLSFKDVNGDGHPDLLVHILKSDIVFINDIAHQQFRPAQPGDHIHL